MPATRRRGDDQSDYEDPIDRYRPAADRPRTKGPPQNPNANTAFTLGLISLVPCLGGLLGPIAVILSFLGFVHARRHPDAGGKGRARGGLALGLLGCFISYVLPIVLYILLAVR